jgi:hypothetical protein
MRSIRNSQSAIRNLTLLACLKKPPERGTLTGEILAQRLPKEPSYAAV